MSTPDLFQSIPVAKVTPEPRWALALINVMLAIGLCCAIGLSVFCGSVPS